MIVECIPTDQQHSTRDYALANSHPCQCVYLYFCEAVYQKLNLENKLADIYSKYTNTTLPVLIINTIREAPTLKDFPFVLSLKEKYPTLRIVHITTGWEEPTLFYTTITEHTTFLWPMGQLWASSLSHTATHHYIALAGAIKEHRTRFINALLNKNLSPYGYFSVGVGKEWTDKGADFYKLNCQALGIDAKNLSHFPTLLDSDEEHNLTTDPKKCLDITDLRIANALVNVVLETSYESNFQNNWITPMLTEKTTKAFALGQIPMILGSRLQLTKTRELGFDMFDDVIDHSYDLEHDHVNRIDQFTESLNQFIKSVSTDQLQDLKDKLMPRFKKNIQLAKELANQTKDLEIHTVLDQFYHEQHNYSR